MLAISGFHQAETLQAQTNTMVVRARRDSDGLPVILKLLGTDSPSATGLAAFRHEFNLTRRLDHPGVSKALDCLPVGSGLMIVFEDIGGTALDRLLGGQPLAIDTFLDMAARLTEALGAIHAAGIVHKDINPANLIWNRATDRLAIIDFSIASELTFEQTSGFGAHLLHGSLVYIAPEQTGRMNRAIDHRADFYSLGATFYECLAGRPPFSATDPLELVHSHIARAPTPIGDLNPAVPAPVIAIIDRLLAKDPEDRYQSCVGLRADLAHCLSQWRQAGRIDAFALGKQDVASVLRLPQRLYGRERQQTALLDAFARTASGGREMVLVRGLPGIGKSALVRELYAPVVGRRGFFLAGKFEQFKRDIPYAPLLTAFGELIEQAQAAPAEQQAEWRARLAATLGPHGRVIVDALPQAVDLVGAHPALPDLTPAETQARVSRAFRDFIAAFTAGGTPIVLFVDDLQWADPASLTLLDSLLTDRDLTHVLIIGAFRDSEVGAGHPLLQALAALDRAGIPATTIELANLDEFAIQALVADALGRDHAEVAPFAAITMARTLGNPLFVGQYVESLDRQGLLRFDPAAARWRWDIDAIAAHPTPDNVVDFLAARLQALPQSTLPILADAACIGSTFDMATLVDISGSRAAEIAAALWPALEARLITPLDDSYRFAEAEDVVVQARYRFLHDRIQQAAYDQIPPETRMVRHLAIGRAIVDRGGHEDGVGLFDAVDHLNRAAPLIATGPEREALIALNLQAGRRARAAAAYGPALSYFRAGLDLLPADAWARLYPTAHTLHAEAAEMAVIAGNHDLVPDLAYRLLTEGRDPVDRAIGHEAMAQLHRARQSLTEALQAVHAALTMLGAGLPERPSAGEVARELKRARTILAGRTEQELVNRPIVGDPTVLAIGRIMGRALSTAYLIDTNLYAILVLRLVILSATSGNQPPSCYAYATYGATFCGLDGNSLYGRVALALLDKLDANQVRAQTLFLVQLFITTWHEPIAATIAGLKEAHRIGQDTGDLEYAAYSLNNIVTLSYFAAEPLGAFREKAENHRQTCIRLSQETSAGIIRVVQQTIANLLGETATPTIFAGPHFDEASDLLDLKLRGNHLGVETVYALLGHLNLLFGEIDAARRYEQARRRYIQRTFGMAVGLRNTAMGTIIDYANWDRCDRREQRAILRAAIKTERLLGRAASQVPENFACLHALVAAERLRATGRPIEAARLYHLAIATAGAVGFSHDEALAAERAAGLAKVLRQSSESKRLTGQAIAAYARWGALAKVRRMEVSATRRRPGTTAVPRVTIRRGRTGTGGSGGDFIDVATVVKATEALAQQIRLADLLRTMMRIVIASAGATRGILVLAESDRWRVEAEASAATQDIRVLMGEPLEQLSSPMARRTILTVIERRDVFSPSDDEAERDRAARRLSTDIRPRSVLGVPLRNRGKFLGVLYLENDLAANVFSPVRLEMLDMLSTQIAISIENARLYDDLERMNRTLEQRVTDRTRELEEANKAKSDFLATMSHEIRTPLNGVLGMVRELLTTALDGRQRDFAETIRYAGEAMLTLVNDTLDLSKIEARQLELETIPFDLRRLMDANILLMSARAREKSIALTAMVDDAVPPRLIGDPTRLRQVLLNLIGNAIKFTDQGRVRVEAVLIGHKDNKCRLRIAVIDSGIGIAPEARRRLFQAFAQADASIARRYGGTGLGLAICQRLIQAMGGEIAVDSTPGQGSEFHFTVTLPTAEAESAAPPPAPLPAVEPAAGLVILLADDEPINRKVTSLLLQREGHRVEAVGTGEAALAQAAVGGIDLVLMDMEMPGIGGLEAARRIRRLPDRGPASVPIIALTGNVDPADVQRCRDAGMNDFLAKPLDPDALVTMINRVRSRQV